MMNVLILDDEKEIADLVEVHLKNEKDAILHGLAYAIQMMQ